MTKKSIAELEQELLAQGYDLEELERDNPYNQWMYENDYPIQQESDN